MYEEKKLQLDPAQEIVKLECKYRLEGSESQGCRLCAAVEGLVLVGRRNTTVSGATTVGKTKACSLLGLINMLGPRHQDACDLILVQIKGNLYTAGHTQGAKCTKMLFVCSCNVH